MSFTIDGAPTTAINQGASSISATLNTTLSDDIIVAFVHLNNNGTRTVTSVTGAGLTWALRSTLQWSDVGSSLTSRMEMWWAYAAAPASGSVTVNFNASAAAASFQMLAVNGCVDFADPWDADGPITNVNNTSTTNAVTIPGLETAATHTLGMIFFASSQTAWPVFASSPYAVQGTTSEGAGFPAWSYTETQTAAYTTAQAPSTQGGGSGLFSNWGAIFDALVGSGTLELNATLDDATISATFSSTATLSLTATLDDATLVATLDETAGAASGIALLLGL